MRLSPTAYRHYYACEGRLLAGNSAIISLLSVSSACYLSGAAMQRAVSISEGEAIYRAKSTTLLRYEITVISHDASMRRCSRGERISREISFLHGRQISNVLMKSLEIVEACES